MALTILKAGLAFFVVLTFAWGVFVYAVLSVPEEEPQESAYTVDDSVPLVLSAASWLVFDVESGEVLYAHNPDTPRPIASVTKLATAARLLEENSMERTATVTATDVAAYGRAGRLKAGEVYTLRELLFPLMLESSNDAAMTLARSDTTLLARMNAYRDELSLSHTRFADPSGLSKENISTARELMRLSRYIFEQEPYIFDITRLRDYFTEQIGWANNNPFFEDRSYRGGKHGYTDAAKLTAVAFFDEPIDDTTRTLGYVLLRSEDLKTDMDALRRHVRQHTRYR